MKPNNVSSIRPDVVVSEGKQTLLDTVAEAYDELAAELGNEPVAIVFAVVGENGACRTGYCTLTAIQDRNALYIQRGAMAINADAMRWDFE